MCHIIAQLLIILKMNEMSNNGIKEIMENINIWFVVFSNIKKTPNNDWQSKQVLFFSYASEKLQFNFLPFQLMDGVVLVKGSPRVVGTGVWEYASDSWNVTMLYCNLCNYASLVKCLFYNISELTPGERPNLF